MHKDGRTGMRGKKHSNETKLKMSNSTKGKSKPWLLGVKKSKESIQKMSEAKLGKKSTEETKKKISENHADVSGKNNPMYGKTHTQETKQKISNTKIGENSPNTKLTELQVIEIRRLYADGNITQKELGLQFGMNYRSIGCILNRKTWKHI